MRTRHRMPMIFSLSMMDVFCCTLGCVILLWLINQREAMMRARAASQVTERLSASEHQRSDLTRLLDDLDRQLAAAQSDLRARNGELAAARARAAELSKQLSTAREQASDAEDRLAKKADDEQRLSRLRDDAKKRVTELERLLRDQELANENAARKIADLTERLDQSDGKLSQLRKLAETLPELQGAISSSREKAANAEAHIKDLERDLASVRAALDAARSEGRDLSGRLARAATAADQRFEGIALTGRNVIFLVDMSGSMDLVDERTPDPAKWVGVRETVQKIMRSLPHLEKFQVLVFSDRVIYPMGKDGQWLNFEPRSSIDAAGRALAATPPKGNTNMYIALEAAFQFRPQGLDTIYLLSDGLPNVGEGLTPQQAQSMTETQRTDALSRAVRTALKTRWNTASGGRAKVRINTVGFFYESPDVGAFLWALARENDGSFVGMSKP